MSVNIVDNSVFTDPIVAIADGDNVNAANTNVPVQGLSNRTRNLKNRVDVHDATFTSQAALISGHTAQFVNVAGDVASNARWNVTSGAIASGDALPLSAKNTAGGGVSITAGFNGHYITLPAGSHIYLVTCHVAFTHSNATDTMRTAHVDIEASTATSFASPILIATGIGSRFVTGVGSPASEPFIVSCSSVVRTSGEGRYVRFLMKSSNLSVYTNPPSETWSTVTVARIATTP